MVMYLFIDSVCILCVFISSSSMSNITAGTRSCFIGLNGQGFVFTCCTKSNIWSVTKLSEVQLLER